MSSNTCPGCGAVYQNNLTCESVFDEFLVLEFADAAYGEVHLLTVACYMIQHGQYSDDALVWIKQRLRDHLEKGIPAEQIRQKAAKETGQGRRAWRCGVSFRDAVRRREIFLPYATWIHPPARFMKAGF